MIDASRRALPGPYSETDGSLRPTIYRKREAELLFALVGRRALTSSSCRGSITPHPSPRGHRAVLPLGEPAPRRSGRTAPSPAGSSRHAVPRASEPDQAEILLRPAVES